MVTYETLEPVETVPTATEKPTLLIVDDEPGPRESLRIVFKDRYQCAIAICGRDGIDFARKNHVDAAILDIKMPDISGVEVLRELKDIDPNIECIMLTGYETVETARAAVRYGAADYLNKPFDVFFVRELLEKCMARRQRKIAMEESLRTLQKMNEELSRGLADSNRAVTANVLSAGVIHEMNNPLAIVAGLRPVAQSRPGQTQRSGPGRRSEHSAAVGNDPARNRAVQGYRHPFPQFLPRQPTEWRIHRGEPFVGRHRPVGESPSRQSMRGNLIQGQRSHAADQGPPHRNHAGVHQSRRECAPGHERTRGASVLR